MGRSPPSSGRCARTGGPGSTCPTTTSRRPVDRANFGPVIVIHRGSNHLYLYKGMKPWRTFTVATGQAIYPTPLGRFRIVVKWKDPWWYPPNSPWAKGAKPIPPGPGNPLGTRWMGLSAPGVGIHGTPDPGVARLLGLARVHPHVHPVRRVAVRPRRDRDARLHRPGLGWRRTCPRG